MLTRSRTLARVTLLGLFASVIAAGSASATPITVDEVLYSAAGVNSALLSGTVDMTLSGSTLTITLTNTSIDAAGSGAGVLLTGIGFQLPTGIGISGGSAYMTGSTAVNFTAPASGNVSSEWGYDTPPLDSGALLGVAALTYNASVSSMTSATTNQFAAGSISQPPNLGGPDFGLVSSAETDDLGSGNEAIRNRIYITLALSGQVPSDLVSSIERGNVALTFGSPDSTRHGVPEPTSLSLFGVGLGALGLLARRRKN